MRKQQNLQALTKTAAMLFARYRAKPHLKKIQIKYGATRRKVFKVEMNLLVAVMMPISPVGVAQRRKQKALQKKVAAAVD